MSQQFGLNLNLIVLATGVPTVMVGVLLLTNGTRKQMVSEVEPHGYLSMAYARGLGEFGNLRHLDYSNGWIVERGIGGSAWIDGLGCYPLFCCANWNALSADLRELRPDLVSLALVADPFGNYDLKLLEQLFDRVTVFKEHYVVDMSRPLAQSIKRSHQATVRRSFKKVMVRLCPDPGSYHKKWLDLFANLVDRHEIRGLRAFSSRSFAYQLRTPGLVMFEALVDGETVGLDIWFVQGDVAYGHLAAFSDMGYQCRASYATKWTVLHYFKDKVQWVDLGGAPGVTRNSTSGLASFKSGWATGTKTAYFCGAVFKPDAYKHLTTAVGAGDTEYFPAYRVGEFM